MARVVVACVLLFAAYVNARNKTPLMDDETRIRNKAAECVFGKQVRELGSQWIPDLGTPIGVLYCMKCECVPIQKKRRIVARVQCRSIKNECPEPTCDEPVHLPDRCCKTCPGDTYYDQEFVQDIVPQNVIDEEEKSIKHYAALLTGRSSLILKNDYILPNDYSSASSSSADKQKNVVATGRFTFHKKNLHFSFYVSDKAARPRSLQFVDSTGNILEEFSLSGNEGQVNSLYQNMTRKVCGVWRRLPRDYRRLLRYEKLYAVLVWGDRDNAEQFAISGQLMKYVSLGSEMFSSLLEPAPGTKSALMSGSGGTAVISISTDPTSIHLAVIFNGLFALDEIVNVPLNITLSVDDRRHILQDTVQVKKPSRELNLVEISTPVSPQDLRLMTKGRLVLTLNSITRPEALRLSGNVVTKATCELFQATINSNAGDMFANPYAMSGLAWMYLNNEGSLVYNVQVDNLKHSSHAVLTLADSKRKTELEDLTPSFSDGWANGTIKLGPKVLELLYSGNLAVNLATENETSLIRGRLTSRTVAEARDAPSPFLLKSENYTLPTSIVGLAWISVDDDCHIHYDISMSGLASTSPTLTKELYLELMPLLAPGAPVTRINLEDEFTSNQVEGSPVHALNREEIMLLDTGVGFLKIGERMSKVVLLAATIRHVAIAPGCRPSYDNDVTSLIYDHSEVKPNSKACFVEGKFYEADAQWTSSQNPCTMCYCQNRSDKCYTMQCPEVNCPPQKKLLTGPGECCPVCVDNFTNNTLVDNNTNNKAQKCYFIGKPYSPGVKFHPFMIPNGFDQCTLCECDAKTTQIKCSRISNEKECCKNCEVNENGTYPAEDEANALRTEVIGIPGSRRGGKNKEFGRGEKQAREAARIMAAGGCKNLYNALEPYANGTEYHPSFESLGEYKCITCNCQNGTSTCKRQRCDKATCAKMFQIRKSGKKINNDDFCCTLKSCKKNRSKKNQRPNNRPVTT